MQTIKLNLGCGDHAPPGWINVDHAWGARLSRLPFFRRIDKRFRLFKTDWPSGILIHDLRRPFPWKNQSVTVVYSSHTLEHMTKEEGRCFLQECQSFEHKLEWEYLLSKLQKITKKWRVLTLSHVWSLRRTYSIPLIFQFSPLYLMVLWHRFWDNKIF